MRVTFNSLVVVSGPADGRHGGNSSGLSLATLSRSPLVLRRPSTKFREPAKPVVRAFPCPCCGHLTFNEPPGSDAICPVCFWEDDVSQLRFALRGGGANRYSLFDSQKNYQVLGAVERRLIEHCRPANVDEPLEENWRPLNLAIDNPETPEGPDRGSTYPEDRTALYYWRPSYWRGLS